MRLIDADSFDYGIIKYMPKSFESVENLIDAWRKLVDEQPTAYDVDRVSEQLRQKIDYAAEKSAEYDEAGKIDLMEIYDAEGRAYRNAEKIVKAGGANG